MLIDPDNIPGPICIFPLMTDRLAIRNVSGDALTLLVLERYRSAHIPIRSRTPIRKLLDGSAESTSKSIHAVQSIPLTHESLCEYSASYTREECARCIAHNTSWDKSFQSSDESHRSVRLTLRDENSNLWRIEIPTVSSQSRRLTPLSSKPSYQYVGAYFPENTQLTIYKSVPPHNWMGFIDDKHSLSALSIPGTHNSACYYRALPSVRCQVVSPKQQLENGIRFFDVRVQINIGAKSVDDLHLVHGAFPISFVGQKKLSGLLDELYVFLIQNPDEILIVSLKREGTGSGTDHTLAKFLHEKCVDSEQWYTEPRIPTLGEVRGKIVLFRRFALTESLKKLNNGRGWGLNAENWMYNTRDCFYGDVRVQDFCEVVEPGSIATKIQLCCDHFDRLQGFNATAVGARTRTRVSSPLHLNFLTASNFWNVGCWPDKVAAQVNYAVLLYLRRKVYFRPTAPNTFGVGGLGVVVCDWVGENGDWDLVQCILSVNSQLL